MKPLLLLQHGSLSSTYLPYRLQALSSQGQRAGKEEHKFFSSAMSMKVQSSHLKPIQSSWTSIARASRYSHRHSGHLRRLIRAGVGVTLLGIAAIISDTEKLMQGEHLISAALPPSATFFAPRRPVS